MTRFNNEAPICDKTINEYEKHFDYRWNNFRAYAFTDEFENVW